MGMIHFDFKRRKKVLNVRRRGDRILHNLYIQQGIWDVDGLETGRGILIETFEEKSQKLKNIPVFEEDKTEI